MAYTPTNWNTGDTITATKLNKLENGVASAGGGGRAVFFTVTSTGFTIQGTTAYGLLYLKKTGNTYSVPTILGQSGGFHYITINANNSYVDSSIYPIPDTPDYYMAIFPMNGVQFTNMSGGINPTPVTMGGYSYYIITGDFALTVSKS